MSDEKWTPERIKQEAIKAYATHGYKPMQYAGYRVLADGTVCACGLGAILLANGISPREVYLDLVSHAASLMSLSDCTAMQFTAGFDNWSRSNNPYSPYALAGRDTWEAVRPSEQTPS